MKKCKKTLHWCKKCKNNLHFFACIFHNIGSLITKDSGVKHLFLPR